MPVPPKASTSPKAGRARGKQASRPAKIAPLVAAFNAIAWMAENPISAQSGLVWI
jgi:hypothetical protein